MIDISILIPAANEMFLKNTVDDIYRNKRGNIEVIVALDGEWADPPLEQKENLNVIYIPKSIGMRGAGQICAKLAQGKYIMKVDAHCSFDEGFDIKMLEGFKISGDNTTMIPIMRNLWVFDWKCYHCGWKKYQGPTPVKCEQCGKKDKIKRKIVWIAKHNPQSTSFCFDTEPHFQYFEAWKHKEPYMTDKKTKQLTETMSIQGSCFMMTREKYFDLNIDDPELGNWGNQGIEVACKTWLSGGQVLVNHRTWYAHMFRTQGGDFSFPWNNRESIVQKTKKNVRDLFWENKWPKKKRTLTWLVNKFWPVKGWTEQDIKNLKGL